MNPEQIKILKLNSECENALIDFPFHDNQITWIQEHHLLFAQTQNINEEITNKELGKNNFIQQFKMLYLTNK
jgi:hypothetical protein